MNDVELAGSSLGLIVKLEISTTRVQNRPKWVKISKIGFILYLVDLIVAAIKRRVVGQSNNTDCLTRNLYCPAIVHTIGRHYLSLY